MRDADGVAQYSRLGVAVIDVDASNEGDQLAVLGAFMGSLGVYRISDQVDGYWIIPHLRYAEIPHLTSEDKNFPAPGMRDNPSLLAALRQAFGSGEQTRRPIAIFKVCSRTIWLGCGRKIACLTV
jgi:hypothetical protein